MALRASRYVAAPPASLDARQARRHVVGVTRIAARRHGQWPVDADLHDISIYGCRIVSAAAHQAGERLWLRFGAAERIAATVVWGDGAAAGCRFDQPIPTRLVREMTLTAG